MRQQGHDRGRQRPLVAALLSCCAPGCVGQAQMDAQIAAIGHAIMVAEANGALNCAPRELAVARSQLGFAELERAQGSSSKAEAHLRIADRHAQAARLLSPVEHCRSRAPARADGPTSDICSAGGSPCGPR
jgi:hypothetical protein